MNRIVDNSILPGLLILLLTFISGPSHVQFRYTQLSRFTDPGEFSCMFENTQSDINTLCKLSRTQLQHHLLHLYFHPEQTNKPANEWSVQVQDILRFLKETPPYKIEATRKVNNRFIGKCTSESYFLASMLRYHNIPVRIRCGFLSNIRSDKRCIHKFWERVTLAKASLYNMNPDDLKKFHKLNTAITCWQNEVNHCIEHWICEYWDKSSKCWRLLDANTDFLRYHSNIDIGYHLPSKYFEFAWSVWLKMRRCKNFSCKSYMEDFQEGKSHIRSLLLWDFYSLLNHDLAGIDEAGRIYSFIKLKTYQELSAMELAELDSLAELLSGSPSIDELLKFYRQSKTLRFPEVESDSYCYLHTGA